MALFSLKTPLSAEGPLSPQTILERYSRIARPLLLSFTKPEARQSDCIGATRMGYYALMVLGLKVEPLAVTWVVQAKALKFAFVCGLRGDELATVQRESASYHKREVAEGLGWDGHLVLSVEDRWLVDSTFDQCAAHPGLDIPPTILVVDCQESGVHPRDASMKLGLSTDSGISLSVIYHPLDDGSWKVSEAWNDPALKIAGIVIADAILHA